MEGKSRRGEEEKMGWDGGCKNNGSQHGRLSRLYGSTRTPVLKTWVLFVLLFGHESFFFPYTRIVFHGNESCLLSIPP
jgi:hypothetical protein